MPFIDIKTNINISKDDEVAIKKELGDLVSLINKSEQWLMISFIDNQEMYFKGKGSPCLIAEVKLYGEVNPSDLEKFTNKVTTFLSAKLSIEPTRIYIAYFNTMNWGYNGYNF